MPHCLIIALILAKARDTPVPRSFLWELYVTLRVTPLGEGLPWKKQSIYFSVRDKAWVKRYFSNEYVEDWFVIWLYCSIKGTWTGVSFVYCDHSWLTVWRAYGHPHLGRNRRFSVQNQAVGTNFIDCHTFGTCLHHSWADTLWFFKSIP